MRVQGVVIGKSQAQSKDILHEEYLAGIDSLLCLSVPNSFLFGARGLFVLEDTFHNTCGAQPSDNDNYTITEFFRDGHSRRGKLKGVANVQSIEGNSMANSHVGKIHLAAGAWPVEEEEEEEEETDHHHFVTE